MQQDELAQMFAQNMSLNQAQQIASQEQQFQQLQPQQNFQEAASSPPIAEPKPIVYSSQHYTHSAHVTPVPRAQSEPPITAVDSQPSTDEEILLWHSIDPALLHPAQMKLFHNADIDQKLRLLELWRISPPKNDGQEMASNGNTSLLQEEAMARMRHQQRQQEMQQAQGQQTHTWSENEQMVEDDYSSPTPTATSAVPSLVEDDRQAEPYMASGYEFLAKRDYEDQSRSLVESHRYNTATDPVYNKVGLWEKPAMQDMENQYGAFAAMREYGADSPPFVQHFIGVHGMEEDMVM